MNSQQRIFAIESALKQFKEHEIDPDKDLSPEDGKKVKDAKEEVKSFRKQTLMMQLNQVLAQPKED